VSGTRGTYVVFDIETQIRNTNVQSYRRCICEHFRAVSRHGREPGGIRAPDRSSAFRRVKASGAARRQIPQ
jgi:hypothetical protein